MVLIRCSKCHRRLDQPGALVFSPPNERDKCKKWHLCRQCFEHVYALMTAHGAAVATNKGLVTPYELNTMEDIQPTEVEVVQTKTRAIRKRPWWLWVSSDYEKVTSKERAKEA